MFEHAVEVTNFLRPDLAIHIGDAIEGYTHDPEQVAAQWEEFDAIIDRLDVPLFPVPGNHDVSNDLMREVWLRRHGLLHYHFTYRDVLFVVLDTQDPPDDARKAPSAPEPPSATENAHLAEIVERDPPAAATIMEPKTAWNGPMPVAISGEQLDWLEAVLADYVDARWTVVCMHMPLWQNPTDTTYIRFRALLANRNATMFAGHVHNYRHTVIDGHDHIRLGPTGGVRVLAGPDGNFDHVTSVTITDTGTHVTNVVLDGILGVRGGTFPGS